MIRSILIALGESPYNASAKDCAFWLARKEGSQIHALAVIDIGVFEIPVLGSPDGFLPSVVTPPLNESSTLLNDLTAAANERLDQFAEQCASRGIRASTEIKTGVPGDVISRTAIAHDIVIVSRTGYNRIANARETVDDWVVPVIRGSVRPVLVAGTGVREGRDIRSVLIAYDGSLHAARALPAAAEFAARPGVDCTLATVASSEEAGRDLIAPAEAYLFHRGIAPRKQIIVSSKPSEVICELATSGGVDFLIMGAYGHSPIREVLLGSTTERILIHCAANVILQS
jgi:nucleotide-binding universal stress UspA family protein